MKITLRFASVLGTALLLASCGVADDGAADTSQNQETPLATTSTQETQTEETRSEETQTEETQSEEQPQDDVPSAERQAASGSGLLAGTADPNLPAGDPGELSIVEVSELDTSGSSPILSLALRNNTDESLEDVEVTVTVRSEGRIVATTTSEKVVPYYIQPGEIALTYASFSDGQEIPADPEYSFTVQSQPVDPADDGYRPLSVTEANLSGSAVVGEATNESAETVHGPYTVSVYCFDGDTLLSQLSTYTDQDGETAVGDSVFFSANLRDTTCPSFLVGVTGWSY